LYHQIISRCAQQLEHLSIFLDKAEAFAAAKRFDPNVFLYERLAPDMYPLLSQIQAACDYAKGGAAHLSGRTPPRHHDGERTIDEARVRILETLAFMRSLTREDFEGAAERSVRLPWKAEPIRADDYLLQVVFPNVYFHAGVAYSILRKGGVDLGKLDFLGEIYRDER
jgi:hypothetical protein